MTRTDKAASAANDTKVKLIAAAAAEFNNHGFAGTDTNRIARAAGFAPQTFYRHFADKTAIFIRVYEQWQHDEREKIAAAMRAVPENEAQALAIAETLLAAHREWAVFRRSLRLLALEDGRVRAARATSRRTQLLALGSDDGDHWPESVAALMTVERLCDAAADREIDDLSIAREPWVRLVAKALRPLWERRSS